MFLIDNRIEIPGPNVIRRDADLELRRVHDGAEFQVIEVFYEPEELQSLLGDEGSTASLDATRWFIFGEACPSRARTGACPRHAATRRNRSIGSRYMEIRLARSDEAEVLAAVLADALGDDPIFCWLIPASRRRDQRLLTFFTAMSSSYLQAGKPAYLAADNAGAALWSDPGTTWRLQFDLGQIRAVLGSFGMSRVVRGVRTQLQLGKLHPAEPHWYLGFLGVRGSRQARAWAARCSTRS